MRSNLGLDMPTQPVIDGKILPALPLNAIKDGSADGVPIMVGSTLDEWTLVAMMDQDLLKLDEDGLVRSCQRSIPAEYVRNVIEAYRNARAKRGVATTPPELFMAIQTDRVFRMPAIHLAEAQHKRGQPAYNYLFTWKSPLFGGRLGACHALDEGFVFGHLVKDFNGSGPAVDTLAGNVQDAWLAFAHTGDPSCESIGKWPTYGDRRETMMLGEKCIVEEAPYDDERCAWDSVPHTIIGRL